MPRPLAPLVRRSLIAGVLLLVTPAARPALGAETVPRARAAALLDRLWRDSGSPAISAAVAARQQLVFSTGVGYANLDDLAPATGATVYNVGSISKVIAAVAVMQLVEAGKVSLDQPVRDFVPALPETMGAITIRQVMTHTSGIRHYGDDDFPHGLDGENVHPAASFEAAIPVWAGEPLRFPPGTLYLYSSYAVDLLEGVVEKASGSDFEEYLRGHVWAPVGMLATEFDRPERIVPHRARSYDLVEGQPRNHPFGDLTYKFAGGGMLSSVDDLVRFGIAVAHGRLLGPEAQAEMLRVQLDRVLAWRGGDPPTEEKFEMALLWRWRRDEAGRRFLYHCGSVLAFNACLVIYPEEDLVGATADNGGGLGFRPTLELIDLFREGPEPGATGGAAAQ